MWSLKILKWILGLSLLQLGQNKILRTNRCYVILHVPQDLTCLCFFTSFSFIKVIEEIVEMMENSPDPGETEEEDEEEHSRCSSRTNPSLLEEIKQLSQASNNNCSHEGKSKLYLHSFHEIWNSYSQTLTFMDLRICWLVSGPCLGGAWRDLFQVLYTMSSDWG